MVLRKGSVMRSRVTTTFQGAFIAGVQRMAAGERSSDAGIGILRDWSIFEKDYSDEYVKAAVRTALAGYEEQWGRPVFPGYVDGPGFFVSRLEDFGLRVSVTYHLVQQVPKNGKLAAVVIKARGGDPEDDPWIALKKRMYLRAALAKGHNIRYLVYDMFYDPFPYYINPHYVKALELDHLIATGNYYAPLYFGSETKRINKYNVKIESGAIWVEGALLRQIGDGLQTYYQETPRMMADRLALDIRENPRKFFCRRSVDVEPMEKEIGLTFD